MDPAFLGPLVPIAAIVAYAAVKIARIRATPSASLPADVAARLEALEQKVDGLHQELADPRAAGLRGATAEPGAG
jgi:hypothetical protein